MPRGASPRFSSPAGLPRLIAGIVLAAGLANTRPHVPGGHTEILVGLHLAIARWLLVGLAYAGPR